MNILFLSLAKFSSIEDNGIYNDLLRKFRDDGHNVLIACPTERRFKKKTSLESKEGVKILRIETGNITKSNIIEKGISTLLLEYQFKINIHKYFSNETIDLILYATPPITFYSVVKYVKNKFNSKAYLLLKDIFPQNAIDLGMIKENSFIHHYFKKKESKLYNISDYIGTMSLANSRYIFGQSGVSPHKVEVCPNTITPVEYIVSEDKKQSILTKYHIPNNKKTFIYGGNLGKPQGIDYLIDCIRLNEKNKNSFIVIVGSGTEYNKLVKVFTDEKFNNSLLLNQLPKKEYELLANSCDVGLIFLDYRFTIPNFPSRLLSYMQASMPVIAATDPNTDIGDVIEAGKFGKKVLSNDVDAFNKVINDFATRDDLEEMGKNARQYLEKHYTTEVAYNTIMKHFEGDVN